MSYVSLSYKLGVFLFLSLSFSLFVCVFIMRCVKFRPRIANWMGEDSCCRGGIVNIRGGCSCAPRIRPESPKALWRFRVRTSNSLIGRPWLHPHTHLCYIYQTYAQQDIRVYEDDHLKPPNRQCKNSKALSPLRVSI